MMAVEDNLREETVATIFIEFDRASSVHEPVWVMSREWFNDIRRMLDVPSYSTPAQTQLVGLPIVIREDAGFPRLVPSSEVPA